MLDHAEASDSAEVLEEALDGVQLGGFYELVFPVVAEPQIEVVDVFVREAEAVERLGMAFEHHVEVGAGVGPAFAAAEVETHRSASCTALATALPIAIGTPLPSILRRAWAVKGECWQKSCGRPCRSSISARV